MWNQADEEEKMLNKAAARERYELMELDQLKELAISTGIHAELVAAADDDDDPKELIILVLLGEMTFFEGVNIDVMLRGYKTATIQIPCHAIVLEDEPDTSARVWDIKLKIGRSQRLTIGEQRLVFNGKQLKDEQTRETEIW